MIRPATINDLDAMMELSHQAHMASPYKDVPSDQDYVRRMTLLAIVMPNFCAFVADEEGKIIGLMVGCVKPNAFGMMTASDVIVYASKPGPGTRLFSRFLRWAKTMPVELTAVTSSFGNEKFDHYLNNMGMQKIGGLFIDQPKASVAR